MKCLFCLSSSIRKSYYPIILFNQKQFQYKTCNKCELTFLDPLPAPDDYIKMYPPEYQNNTLDLNIQKDWAKKLPGLRFSYAKHFELIKKYCGEGASILDYGCGNAHFIMNAQVAGFRCTGAEFNPEYLKLLQSETNLVHFILIEDLIQGREGNKYDVIRLSNVFEHLVNPHEVIEMLANHLTSEGIFLIEGPVEHNKSLAFFVRSFYFSIFSFLKPKRTVVSPPYHIIFSNYSNQKEIFSKLGLQNLYFGTSEDPWPFPSSVALTQSLFKNITAVIGIASTWFSKTFKTNWGNIFIYVGKKK